MEASFQRRELVELLHRLDNPDRRGVFIIGGPGVGKTVLLQQLEAELQRQGRAAFLVSLMNIDVDDLSTRIMDEITRVAGAFEVERTIRASGGDSLRQSTAVLNRAAERLQTPVLLLDGLDESRYPRRTAAAVEELSEALNGWRLVVASRPGPGIELRRFVQFDVLQLGPLTEGDMVAMLRESAPTLAEDVVSTIVRLANGNPLIARLVARRAQDRTALGVVFGDRLEDLITWLVDNALSASPDPDLLGLVLEELALAAGRDRISALAGKLRIPEDQLRRILSYLPEFSLLTVDQQAGTVAFAHASVQDAVLSRRVFLRPFRLAELKFGAEEAERDDLLDASFVGRHSLDRILGQQRSIVIGNRGSGKSAIFLKLVEERSVETFPVANTGDLLHRIVDKDAWLDADALRAAWLVVIAAVAASTVPGEAPKALRRNAEDLRAALGLPTEPPSRTRRAMRAAARLLGGTTLKFGVGPVNFEATLPVGTRPGGSFLDIESLLQDTDNLLKQTGRRVVVLLDRIDETFKYDRGRQEALVQALLQAEGRVSLLDSIGLVVFLRSDLFELYDIQEKNKLVSRSLALDWSEDDWLQVLIRRVFANEPLVRLARRLRVADEEIEVRAALEVLFPAEIESQPVDRWLVDSLRDGNGNISPRLAVLLLHLTRERSARPDAVVAAAPLFSADAVQRAMTKLSDLSFSEVVNDFKVAPTFVLNCRAGKLTSFTLPEVEQLFDGEEGKIGDQVRLLERLGFLERVVEQHGTQTRSTFRIPRLYTRCWDYA
ncbi:ATP-binding protein [Streptomyces sp. N2A]|uniref:ATP-binding protein n=1 Tax=Streptomyces sp. N2A TaxID=3073936 RepID=UPI00287010D5|nr:ATP-binding protein [Streptomyces sp. N2A]